MAARLEENPNDLDGWRRLARSYRVLGEEEKAVEAEERIAALEAGRAGGEDAAPRATGPSDEDVAAAVQGMTPEERAEMIRGMVDTLAARLEENPNDPEGWLRLAQSYRVLGEPQKALEALRQAVELSPEHIPTLRSYARSIVAVSADPDGLPPEAVEVYERILVLDDNDAESLWFVGFAEVARGNSDTARQHWERLLAQLQPGTPDHKAVQEAINAL